MKNFLALAGCGLLLSMALDAQTFSGYRRAVDFAYGATINPMVLAFPTSIGANVTVTVKIGNIVLPTGEVIAPLTTKTPVTIGTGAGAETVTPISVTCITPSLLYTCTFTAAITKSHAPNDPVSSATFGLQEALNYQHVRGGGAIVDQAWSTAGGTNTMLLTVATYQNSTVFDLRGAGIYSLQGASQQISASCVSGVCSLSLPANLLLPPATSGPFYRTIGNNGATQAARSRLNLIPGNNVTLNFGDNVPTGSTDVTISSSGSGINQLTGDVTAGPGTGSQATTLANSGVTPGSCGDATHSCSITTDVKGRVTSQSNNAISGGGGSVFTGSTAAAPAFSATPTFSLADVTVKSPVRVEPGAMTANVTSVTFTNKTAGAKFSLVWLQDGAGGHTVSYGASANNTCTVTADANVATTQFLEVAADGATVNGVGCSDNSGLGKIVLPEGTAPAGIAASDIIYADSVAHRAKMINNNGTADAVVGANTTDTLTGKTFDTAGAGNSLKVAGTAITAVSGTGAVCLATGSACAGAGSSTAKLPIWAGLFIASTGAGGGNANASWWQIGGLGGFGGCSNTTGGNPPEICELGMSTAAGQNLSYFFPWDTAYTAVDLHFVFGQSSTSAGNFRFTAQLMCNTLGTSIRSGTWTLGTASTTATIVAPGTANTGIAVNITSINIPTCAATSPMVIQLTRDQTVASNDADEARLYTGSIIVTRTLP